MTLTRLHSDPWTLMNQWRHDMDRVFNGYDKDSHEVTAAAWVPAVDIKEEDDAFVLQADVPGVKPEDIELHMENGVLTIKGQRQSESRKESEGYSRVERVSGRFYRRFSLPDTTDAEKISAKSDHGVLEVRIPKQEKLQPRRIEVAIQH